MPLMLIVSNKEYTQNNDKDDYAFPFPTLPVTTCFVLKQALLYKCDNQDMQCIDGSQINGYN